MAFIIRLLLVAVFTFVSTLGASAAEVKVMISGGLTAAFKQLVPQFEKATGNTVVTSYGPSMGETPQAIPMRLARGEPADVLIMVGSALGDLVTRGKVIAASRVDVADSPIGIAVKEGAPKPDIATPDALKATLLAAKSIAYSDSASGVYIEGEMLKKLGIQDQVKGKSKMIPAEPVAMGVARGDAEIGFQTISELLPIPGVTVVGPVPDAVQKITWFAAGIVKGSKHEAASRALITYISSPDAAAVMQAKGMIPGAPKAP